MDCQIPTRILTISNTHGANLNSSCFSPVDLVIHCGDITQESTLDEIKQGLGLLQSFDAPLKLVIARNHDFTLDATVFEQRLTEAGLYSLEQDKAVKQTYGGFGKARALLERQRDASIIVLDEGTHEITLANEALLKVFASPCTSSKTGGWGFCYHPDEGHTWNIGKNIDIVFPWPLQRNSGSNTP